MIAAVKLESEQPRIPKLKGRPPAQAVEIRLVIELQLPPWLQGIQHTLAAAAASPIAKAVESVVRQDSPEQLQDHEPSDRPSGSAFVVTSSQLSSPAEVVSNGTPDQPVPSESTERETMLALYERCVLAKKQRSAGKKAIAEHLSSCRFFDRFVASQIHLRPQTPMVNLLKTADLLRSFGQWMIVDLDLSVATASRRVEHVAMVAKTCFQLALDKPTEKEMRRMDDAKPKKKSVSDARRIPSFDEVNALATAVTVAKWPYHAHAPYFWRGLIRMAAYIGFRTYDVVSLIPEKTGLCKSDVVWSTLCPVADVSNALGKELHSPHGWLHYSIEKDKHSDCRRILIPMPKWLRDWVRFFFELSEHSERIFPSMKQQALDSKSFGQTWRKIREKAAVDPRIMLSEGTGNVIALRKYAANWWHLATLRAKSDSSLADKMSHYVLHHAEVTTANKHYLSVQAAVLPVMLELMNSWPVPAADAPHVSLLPE